jgi:hypothetical protein
VGDTWVSPLQTLARCACQGASRRNRMRPCHQRGAPCR